MELAPPRKTIYGTLPVHLLPLTCLCRIRGNSHELRSPMRDEISVPGLRRVPEFHAGFWAGPVASMMGVAGSGGSHGVRTFYAGFNGGPCFFVRDQALCAARIWTPGCAIGSLSHVECTAKWLHDHVAICCSLDLLGLFRSCTVEIFFMLIFQAFFGSHNRDLHRDVHPPTSSRHSTLSPNLWRSEAVGWQPEKRS